MDSLNTLCETPIKECCEPAPKPIATLLSQHIARLERDLAEAKATLEVIEKEPKIVEVLDVLRRVQRRL